MYVAAGLGFAMLGTAMKRTIRSRWLEREKERVRLKEPLPLKNAMLGDFPCDFGDRVCNRDV